MENLVCNWYGWVVFVAVFLAAAATIYVFFDSQELSTPNPANSARILAAIGTVLTLPALYLRMTETFPPSCALDPMTLKSMLAVISNADVFSYLGIAGVLLGLGAGVYYYAGIKSPPPPPLPPPPITQSPPLPPSPPPPRTQAPPPPLDPTRPLHQESPPSAWLVVRSGPRANTQFGLTMQRQNIVGRDPNRAEIVIEDDTVSREHARVRYENGQFVLYDLASTSGTYVNDNRIQRQMLYDNDRITLGRVELIFKKVA